MIERFFERAVEVAKRKLAQRFPGSVNAGVYEVDDVSITVAFDPHVEVVILPQEVRL